VGRLVGGREGFGVCTVDARKVVLMLRSLAEEEADTKLLEPRRRACCCRFLV
jgi:hypothetical protein